MAQFTLILDSCCDLPYELVDKDDVILIRFPFFFDTEEFLDDMWHENDPHEFYDRIRHGEQPHTAQAGIAQITEAFEKAAELDKPAIYVCFTSGMSGSYDSAVLVAQQVREAHPGFDLRVLDSRLASTAESVIAFEAIRQQESNMGIDEFEEWATEARFFANVLFMVEDLECLHRGGRIPKSVAVVGSKLDVKPLITIAADGSLSVKGVARGRKKGLKQLVSYYMDRHDPDAPPFVHTGNADCPKDMKRMQDMIRDESDLEPIFIEQPIGPVIGSHVGPGMVSLCFWGQDRRLDESLTDKLTHRKSKAQE